METVQIQTKLPNIAHKPVQKTAKPKISALPLLQVQQQIGNQAVLRLLRGKESGTDTRASQPAISQKTGNVGPELQKASLQDYNDKNVLHDPSRLTDAEIQDTIEFKELHKLYGIPPNANFYTQNEILLACRLILRDIREGKSFALYPMVDGPIYLQQARTQLGSMKGVAALENQLNWVPFNSGAAATNPSQLQTEFGKWLLAGGPEPDAKIGLMNCWEAVLFGAYKAGYTTKSRLKAIYDLAVDNIRKGLRQRVGDTVEAELKGSNEYIADPTNADSPWPLSGDIVVFNKAADHTGISTGKKYSAPMIRIGEHEILSLWYPNNKHVEKTTIEEMLRLGAPAPVKFWSAKW
jgi:hypothetical protein